MDWFNRNSLEGLVEGALGMAAALAAAVQGVSEELYTHMETMEKRVEALEQNAVAVRYTGDGKLDILPAVPAVTGAQEGKGADAADGG